LWNFAVEHVLHCICGGTGYVRVQVPVGHFAFGEAIPCRCQINGTWDKQAAKQGLRDNDLADGSEVNLGTGVEQIPF
jgi:hypothetical protein